MASGEYIQAQLEAFTQGARSNDINLSMRTIASDLTENERQAIAKYYGSGMGLLPASGGARLRAK